MKMENITREKRKSVANAQKVVDLIKERTEKENGKKKEKKLDLSSIAKDLADRRDSVLEKEQNEEL